MNSRIARLVVSASLLIGASAACADTFKVDPVHSMIVFKVQHMGAGNIFGRFNGPEGSFVTDDDASKMSFEVTAAVDKIDTANAARDKHLKSADFFNAKQFPEITFKSTSVKKADDKSFEVTGDLTLHGVTKSITVTLTKVGQGNVQNVEHVGFETSFNVKRSDYGITFMPSGVGDDVTLWVAFEGAKQ